MTGAQAVSCLLAVDPGREKCGVAVVSATGDSLEQSVVSCGDLPTLVADLCRRRNPEVVVVGNRTGHAAVVDSLREAGVTLPVRLVDEHNSSWEARALYFAHHPPRGWRRLLPRSLQTPPVPLDDYAAVILARRFLRSRSEPASSGPGGS